MTNDNKQVDALEEKIDPIKYLGTSAVIDDDNDTQTDDENPPDPIEEQALDEGWVPKDKWKGNPDEWRSAREFVARGELIKKISYLNKKLDHVTRDLSLVAEHHSKYVEREKKRTTESLLGEKRKALEDGDHDKVINIDQQLLDTMQDPPPVLNQQDSRGDQKEAFSTFLGQNKWYQNDDELTDVADTMGVGYFNKHPDKTYEEIYNFVHKQIRKAYPEKFNRDVDLPIVNTTKRLTQGHVPRGKGSKYTADNLTSFQRQIAERFIQSGAVKDLQEYVDQLASIDGIEK